MYSDQQLITGLAILISAYAQLNKDITAYHWQIMVYLAWFASLSHLTTLTALRHYFVNNSRARRLRIILMSAIVVALFVALLPTGNSTWWGTLADGSPTRCYFSRLGNSDAFRPGTDSGQGISLVVSELILVSSFLSRITRLSPGISTLLRRWFWHKPCAHLESALKKAFDRSSLTKADGFLPRYYYTACIVVSICLVILSAAWEIFESMLWEVSHASFSVA